MALLVPSRSSRRWAAEAQQRAPRTLVRWWASAPTITFSSAVISGNSRMFWKVRAMPSSVIWCASARPASAPSKRTCPAVGRYTPVSTLKQVVLPAPLGPISPRISPWLDVEADVVEGGHAAEAQGDRVDLEQALRHRLGAPPSGPPARASRASLDVGVRPGPGSRPAPRRR